MRARLSERTRRELLSVLAAGTAGGIAGCLGNGGDEEWREVIFTHLATFGTPAEKLVEHIEDETDKLVVDTLQTPDDSTSMREFLREELTTESPQFDVAMMDIIWVSEFVENGWTLPLEGVQTENMLETPVEAATVDGTLHGVPLYTDANALYYRRDKLDEYEFEPPETYTELIEQAQTIQEADAQIENGYIWQGGQNEGLTIMWLNWPWGLGGSVRDGEELVVNSQTGVDALGHAVDLIHEQQVTPEFVTTSTTDQNRLTFQRGNTLFMRNWPYAVNIFNDNTPVTGKFDVTTLPTAAGHEEAANSCLGGWFVVIVPQTDAETASREFVSQVGTQESQELLALKFSRLPIREELYADKYVDQQPVIEFFADVLGQAKTRPATADYNQFSQIVFENCHEALRGNKTPQEALDDAQARIDEEIN